MRVGFLSNQLENRGTGNAMLAYAHYNEHLLGNESKIFTFRGGNHNPQSEAFYIMRFNDIHYVEDGIEEIDVLYHIKSGYDDGFRAPKGIRYVVHSVFDNVPHGDRYVTVSSWMGKRYNLSYVPHIVELPSHKENIRKDLLIANDAVVFGRHGGQETFDISWAWETVDEIAELFPQAWFLFMNTAVPDYQFNSPQKIVFIQPTMDFWLKKAFINTCDAMIHARFRGETFGISVAEFAISGKPVITYSESSERAHLHELGDKALLYSNQFDLSNRLTYVVNQAPLEPVYAYTGFDAVSVMQKFKEIFLD